MNVASTATLVCTVDSTVDSKFPPLTVEEMTRRLIIGQLRHSANYAAEGARALRLEAQKVSGADRHAFNLSRVGGRGERRHRHLALMWARGRAYSTVETQPKDLSYDVSKSVRGDHIWDLVLEAFKRVQADQVTRAANDLAHITPAHPMQAFAGQPMPFKGWLEA